MKARNQLKKIWTGVCVAVMCFSLFGCGNSALKKNIQEVKALPYGTMVLDYFEQVVGTETARGYDEIVLLISDPGFVEIDVYHKPDGDNAVEKCTRYRAEDKLIDEVYALVDKYEMSKWDKMQSNPIDGLSLVIKFRENGEMMRVNSGNMTKKYGEQPFSEVYALLRKAAGNADVMQ